jgi:4,5-DOPA dioxygenase extradiol
MKASEKMPVLFVGHGSPMNALAKNRYTQMLNQLGGKIPTPKVILVISAHWMSHGTWVTQMAQPKTIHDFGGFPQSLFDIQYPAPGSPETASLIQSLIKDPHISLDSSDWGLDHGTWSVLRHMYPEAKIPVLQMSLSMRDAPEYHLKLGRELASLREKGVLILGSGNVVHNLRQIQWDEKAKPHDWAVEFDEWIKVKIEKREFADILKGPGLTNAGRLSVPTADHYLPLHYILGASDANDELRFEFEEMQNASISMRTLSFGRT